MLLYILKLGLSSEGEDNPDRLNLHFRFFDDKLGLKSSSFSLEPDMLWFSHFTFPEILCGFEPICQVERELFFCLQNKSSERVFKTRYS